MELSQISEKVEEVSAKYAAWNNIERDDDWFLFKLHEEVGELTQKYLMLTGRARKKGLTDEEIRRDLEEEVADTLGQLLLLSKRFNIDLEQALERKWFVWLEK